MKAGNLTTDSTWSSPRSDQGISDAFRTAMRSLPHSVAVVTSLAESPSLQPCLSIHPTTDSVGLLSPYFQDFCGATISSLQSVTLGPPAIISFNLKMPSRTLSGLLHHKQFGVHLLMGSERGREVADAFIQQSHHEAYRLLSQNGRWVGLGLSPIERVEHVEKRVPLIRGSGIFTFMKCEVLSDKCVQVGDHMVVIAKVASIGLSERTMEILSRNTLSYVHGEYRGVSSCIKQGVSSKAQDITIRNIRANSLRLHNDALGTSTSSMESTLAEFCQQVQRELPEHLQAEITRYLPRGISWVGKALIMQRLRESHARGEHPEFANFVKKGSLFGNEDVIQVHASFNARSPSNFWGHPPEDWPSTSPPWLDGIERPPVSPQTVEDYSGFIRINHDSPIQTVSRDGEQSLAKVQSMPKPGSIPLHVTGRKEDDGDMSNLTDEGYQALDKS